MKNTGFAQRVVITDNQKTQTTFKSPHREAVEREVNLHKVTIDRECFKKTQAEKDEFKIEKAHFNINPEKNREEVLKTLMYSKAPNWNLTIIVK